MRHLALLLVFLSHGVFSQTPLRAKVFPGAQALPVMAGVQQGIFERHGIKLELLFTQTSQEQRDGLAIDAQFDLAGFRNVLALRAEIEGDWGGKPPAPERFIDLSYYQKAVQKLR